MKKKSSLDQLDQWFASKGNSANNYFYIALLFVGLVAYFILSNYADPYLEESETNLSTATTKLEGAQREYNEFFGGDPEAFVNNKRNILNGAKTNLNNIIEERGYLDDKLNEISKLTYNEKNWAKFMDSLSTIAENNNIKIYAIHSDRREPSIKQIFQPEALLDIDVKFEGAFSNVLRYINLIEQSEMIVDVNKMDINATKNGKIGGSIGISIWGVNY
ncbi:hypothetical protein [Campylobacter gracilis]|uniref:Pilus assembly protein, PilO n=1 Tax=Campylobacter gracilis RM3268 TaxID=553220 RepID=C8PFY4_9BACT|nr:hypothetical protein [Campylobacter gracilis]AKT92681.1 hypothetical protein CGRAC_1234 [Campylobacter gracilis]EEV18022.1 hypothetical protein CAMGR0001_0777 [Campylobacter gracilis RM3268]UEB45143.1 hypothetical protein LK410_09130 [Campylobacter gracilis]SUW82195.1 Uncharacterised protein [Campylobacter gracilis]